MEFPLHKRSAETLHFWRVKRGLYVNDEIRFRESTFVVGHFPNTVLALDAGLAVTIVGLYGGLSIVIDTIAAEESTCSCGGHVYLIVR
jgi:hypothetical protein